jgi:hypothetical protein
MDGTDKEIDKSFLGDIKLEELKLLSSTVDRRRPAVEVGGEIFAHEEPSDENDEHGVSMHSSDDSPGRQGEKFMA